MSIHLPYKRLALGLCTACILAPAAQAEGSGKAIALHPKYQQECAACHVAFPPNLLPATSWSRIMGGLARHFGVDASLDAATTQEIAQWLHSQAGNQKRAAEEPPQDRITRSKWFVRQHDEVSAASWKLPSIKSAANCSACHTTADKGDFNERNVRIPR